jgi:tetratricopeptide (TPR) repeat protein
MLQEQYMPSSYEAYWRHANLYLSAAEGADELFSKKLTQEKGITIFDQNREQIESAIEWIIHQDATSQTDILLSRFADALSSIGMVRYSVKEKLIPLIEQKIAAAQRLGWKDLEADSFDGLGILHAFLGYLQLSIQYFEMAYEIANRIGNEELKRNIQTHIRLAHKQLKKKNLPPTEKFPGLLRLILLRLRLLFAEIIKNPYTEITTLNSIANIYLDLRKWNSAIRHYQRAIAISKKHSYRFGELQASMGLLQAEMSKNMSRDELLSASRVSNLASDFEWSTDLSVFETLLEIAPAIQNAESIAIRLSRKNDPRTSEIYKQLDQIMIRTSEIVSAASERSTQKHEVFIAGLKGIKDNLASITEINSNNSPG